MVSECSFTFSNKSPVTASLSLFVLALSVCFVGEDVLVFFVLFAPLRSVVGRLVSGNGAFMPVSQSVGGVATWNAVCLEHLRPLGCLTI